MARLNTLLRFGQTDPWLLTNGKRDELVDDLYFAIYGIKRDPHHEHGADFAKSTTREGLKRAYEGLKEHLVCGDKEHHLEIGPQTLWIRVNPNSQEYYYQFDNNDLRDRVFVTYADALFMAELKEGDIVKCANCRTQFVPLRKPKKGKPSYCSKRCANVIASRNFRANKRAKTKKKAAKKKPK